PSFPYTAPATSSIYPLSLHDALPIYVAAGVAGFDIGGAAPVPWAEPGTVVLRTSGTTGTPKGVPLDEARLLHAAGLVARHHGLSDRKSTRLNSSHRTSSYAVFCLKKK